MQGLFRFSDCPKPAGDENAAPASEEYHNLRPGTPEGKRCTLGERRSPRVLLRSQATDNEPFPALRRSPRRHSAPSRSPMAAPPSPARVTAAVSLYARLGTTLLESASTPDKSPESKPPKAISGLMARSPRRATPAAASCIIAAKAPKPKTGPKRTLPPRSPARGLGLVEAAGVPKMPVPPANPFASVIGERSGAALADEKAAALPEGKRARVDAEDVVDQLVGSLNSSSSTGCEVWPETTLQNQQLQHQQQQQPSLPMPSPPPPPRAPSASGEAPAAEAVWFSEGAAWKEPTNNGQKARAVAIDWRKRALQAEAALVAERAVKRAELAAAHASFSDLKASLRAVLEPVLGAVEGGADAQKAAEVLSRLGGVFEATIGVSIGFNLADLIAPCASLAPDSALNGGPSTSLASDDGSGRASGSRIGVGSSSSSVTGAKSLKEASGSHGDIFSENAGSGGVGKRMPSVGNSSAAALQRPKRVASGREAGGSRVLAAAARPASAPAAAKPAHVVRAKTASGTGLDDSGNSGAGRTDQRVQEVAATAATVAAAASRPLEPAIVIAAEFCTSDREGAPVADESSASSVEANARAKRRRSTRISSRNVKGGAAFLAPPPLSPEAPAVAATTSTSTGAAKLARRRKTMSLAEAKALAHDVCSEASEEAAASQPLLKRGRTTAGGAAPVSTAFGTSFVKAEPAGNAVGGGGASGTAAAVDATQLQQQTRCVPQAAATPALKAATAEPGDKAFNASSAQAYTRVRKLSGRAPLLAAAAAAAAPLRPLNLSQSASADISESAPALGPTERFTGTPICKDLSCPSPAERAPLPDYAITLAKAKQSAMASVKPLPEPQLAAAKPQKQAASTATSLSPAKLAAALDECFGCVDEAAANAYGAGKRLRETVTAKVLAVAWALTKSQAGSGGSGGGAEGAEGCLDFARPLLQGIAAVEAVAGGSWHTEPGLRTQKSKRVRFRAFDLSAVDMPIDGEMHSVAEAERGMAALEAVLREKEALERILSQEALRATWQHFLRCIAVVGDAARQCVPPLSIDAKISSISGGNNQWACSSVWQTLCAGSASCVALPPSELADCATFCLGELSGIGEARKSGYAHPLTTLLQRQQALASTVARFHLRRLLNPPPPTLSVQPENRFYPTLLSVSEEANFHFNPAAYASTSTSTTSTFGRSRVWRMLRPAAVEAAPLAASHGGAGGAIAPETAATEGATASLFARALTILAGHSDATAERAIAAAEHFSSEAVLRSPAWAKQALSHHSSASQALSAARARAFASQLLSWPGLEEAIAEQGGWGCVEAAAAALGRACRKASSGEESAEDGHILLLRNVNRLRCWLEDPTAWRWQKRASAVVGKLGQLLTKQAPALGLSQHGAKEMLLGQGPCTFPALECA